MFSLGKTVHCSSVNMRGFSNLLNLDSATYERKNKADFISSSELLSYIYVYWGNVLIT